MNIHKQKNFKELPKSYWLDSTPDTSYPTLEHDIAMDLIIVGGGLVGISCAYLLGNEGLKVAILEADRICKGTTAHTTAKITSQHGLIYSKIRGNMGNELAQQYADANELAIGEIKRIVDKAQIDCDYIPQSAFTYTQDDKYIQKIEDEVDAASELGIKASYVGNIPFPMDIKGAVEFHNQAQFHPRKYILGLSDILNDDVKIFENTRVSNIEEDGEDYVLITNKGKKARAKRIIMASHYPFYNKHGGYFTRIYPEKSYIVGINAKEKYPGGMYINAEDPARSLRHQNTENGELILVVGEHHKTGQSEDTNKHYQALLSFANTLFTIKDIPYRWSTQDCMTLDGVPYVGNFTTNTPNLYMATGFGKWGMTNSMVSAMILRDLIVKGRSPWQDVYNPSR
ncbi:MAG: FAD-binding oxidoreductase, partial [Tissierellia bacterium]|nr:FAD-binding oxidoreductase [Tissierellia bacterium]